jgi:hypothetical protein
MGVFGRWASKPAEIEKFNAIMNASKSVEEAFAHAVFAARANKSDFSALFGLLNTRVIGKKMDLNLSQAGILNALDDIEINDCLSILDAQLEFMKKYPGSVVNLLIYIPFALDGRSAPLLSAKLQDFFKKLPSGVQSFQLRLAAANKVPLSVAASQAMREAASQRRVEVKLINIASSGKQEEREIDTLMGGLFESRELDPVVTTPDVSDKRSSFGSLPGDDEVHTQSPTTSKTLKALTVN